MKKKFLLLIPMAALFFSQSVTVFAVTESEVEAVGKETAAGNVFIWFLCAIAFLKISQKIDSFLSSLGINVGHTGGSMMAELMIAARGLTTVKSVVGGSFFKGGSPPLWRNHQQYQCLLPVRRTCRGCGKAVYTERHAHHDRAGKQPDQPQGF